MGKCIEILFYILTFYNFFLVAGIIMSWFPVLYKFRLFRIIATIGNWYMEPFTGVLVLGPLDFTPIIGFFLYDCIISLLVYLL